MSVWSRKAAGLMLVAVMWMGSGSASAMQVMDFQAEALLLNSAQLKSTINLSANQQTLWQQTEAKLHGILHQRQIRREHLQSSVEDAMGKQSLELRDLNARVEAEEQQTLEENKQIRELFLSFNDALDDQQRAQVQSFLMEQLLSRPDAKKTDSSNGNNDNQRKQGGHSRGGMSGGGIKF